MPHQNVQRRWVSKICRTRYLIRYHTTHSLGIFWIYSFTERSTRFCTFVPRRILLQKKFQEKRWKRLKESREKKMFFSHTPITHTHIIYFINILFYCWSKNQYIMCISFLYHVYFLSLFFIVSVSTAAASSFHFFLRYYQPLKPRRGIASIFLGKYKEFNSLSRRSSWATT